MYRWIILALFFFAYSAASAQEVVVSKDINIRSDYAYEIVGHLEDRILLYRDRGFEHKVASFDKDLTFGWERKLRFDKNKVEVFGIVPVDTAFYTFFAFKDDDTEYVKANLYDLNANIIREDTILMEQRSLDFDKYTFLLSEDRQKAILYKFPKNNELDFVIYDVKEGKFLWAQRYALEDFNLRRDLQHIVLTNVGEILLLFERYNNKFRGKKHIAEFIRLSPSVKYPDVHTFSFEERFSQDIHMSYDNANHRLCIAGLYSEKSGPTSKGYFVYNGKISGIQTNNAFQFVPFDDAFLRDVYGKKASKRKGLQDHIVRSILWRHDGGIILTTEMNREFSRRSSYQSAGSYRADYYSLRGWTDFHNEDIVLVSVHPNGEEHWKTVLFKKQFSQDDQGIYSSFFLFKTPSRLRLIFNDEIKKENTVSEYMLSPTGQTKRSSLLSTEYQKLKLRFRDALQLSASELIVPSERNNNLSLVKITYGG